MIGQGINNKGSIGLVGLALMGGILGGSHTLGHLDTAKRNDVPVHIKGLAEYYDFKDTSSEERGKINGAGFRMQDKIANAFDGTDAQEEARLANAVFKISQLLGLPKMLDPNINRGDIKDIKADVGGFPREIIAATAVADMLKAKGLLKNTSLSFNQSSRGTPMLQMNRRF